MLNKNKNTNNPIEELRNRLANNPLADTNDTLNYWQYAARLATLGDDNILQKIMSDISADSVQKWSDALKKRCIRGINEVMEYEGEELALSIIDANDFYCFEKRSNNLFAELQPYFAEWQDVCEHAQLNDEAADLLRGFIAVFNIPEDDRLPVIDKPLSETEYALLQHIYKDVRLPIVKLQLHPRSSTKFLAQKGLYDTATEKYTASPSLLWAADDGSLSDDLMMLIATEGEINATNVGFTRKIVKGQINILQQLDERWNLNIYIYDDEGEAIPVDSVRIADVPALQDENEATHWLCSLNIFSPEKRTELLESSVIFQLTNGYKLECQIPFCEKNG
jgi:hypothetical protein